MDLFGFKKRRAERERNARIRAEAMQNAIRTVEDRPAPPARRRPYRPEADRSDTGLYGGGLYPHSSASGMAVDNTLASWAQPVQDTSDREDRSSRHSDPAPETSSARTDDSSSSGYTNTDSYTNSGSGYTNSDSGYSSGSSGYDSGGSSSGYSSSDSGSFSSSD